MWRRLLRRLFGSETLRDQSAARTTPDDAGGGEHAGPPPVHRAWAKAPPLRTARQRPMRNVSHIDRFSGALVQRHTGVRYLAPLVHDVTPDAPSGIASGLTRAVDVVPSRAPVRELPLAPAGRRKHSRPGPDTTLAWPADPEPTTGPSSGPDRAPAIARAPVAAAGEGESAPETPDPAPPTDEPAVDVAGPSSTEPARPPAVAEPTPTGPDLDAPAEPDEPRPEPETPGGGGDPTPGDTAPRRGSPPTTPTAPLVHHPPRVLRSAAAAPSTRRPLSRAPAPSDMPLRRLAVQRDHDDADLPSSVESPEPEPADVSEPAQRAVAEADPTTAPDDPVDRDNAEPPAAADPDEPPATDDAAGEDTDRVRPTLGGPGDRPLVQPSRESPTSVPPSTPESTPEPREGPGIGAPLDALPPSARPLTERGRHGLPPVTGHGRSEAINRGLQQLSGPTGPAPGDTSPTRPVARAARAGPQRGRTDRSSGPGGSTRRPGGSTRGPDRSKPPIVARRLDPTVAAPPRARSTDVLPLTSHRPPLVESLGDDLGRPTAQEGEESRAVPVTWPPVRDWSGERPARPGRTPDGPIDAPEHTPVEPPASGRGPGGGEPVVPIARVQRARSDDARRNVGLDRPGTAPASLDDRGDTGGLRGLPRSFDASGGLGDLPRSFEGHPLVQRLKAAEPERTTNGSSADGPPPAASPPPSLPLASPPDRPTRTEDPRLARAADERPVDGVEPTATAEPDSVVQRAPVPEEATRETGAEPELQGPDVAAMFDELYPRVLDEIRWDLRVQRERAGLLTDPL